MNEIEKSFVDESRDRAITARSSHPPVKSAGARLVSDGLTKSQLAAKNGEVQTYSLSEPMSWDDFKKMPTDLQQAYLAKVAGTFPTVNIVDVARRLFGISRDCLVNYMYRARIKVKFLNCRNQANHDLTEFLKWLGDPQEPVETGKCRDFVEDAIHEHDREYIRQLEDENRILKAQLEIVKMIFGPARE